MRFVFDLDYTICTHKNRDFELAVPIEKTVDRMRMLKAEGHELIIFTARGQNSCRGDLEQIERKYRESIERWLRTNKVPYDKLVFGKPLGDFYVDDKGLSLDQFYRTDFYKIKTGNSGAVIYRAGDHILKTCKNAQEQCDWYEEARGTGLRVPYVHSVVLGTIDMQFIQGIPGNKAIKTAAQLSEIVGTIMMFSVKEGDYTMDVEKLIERAREHLEGIKDWRFYRLFEYLQSNAREYARSASFCHGDLSLSNIIVGADGRSTFIDPIVSKYYSSYLMDFAKLKFSLGGGELFLHGEEGPEYEELSYELVRILERMGIYKLVTALEAVYWIRLLKYTPANRQRLVIEHAKCLERLL